MEPPHNPPPYPNPEIIINSRDEYNAFIQTLPINKLKLVSLHGENVLLSKDEYGKIMIYFISQNGYMALVNQLHDIQKEIRFLSTPSLIQNKIDQLHEKETELKTKIYEKKQNYHKKNISPIF